ncbi:MAG TPA: SagB/ThcOx family dehydrogenase, partial [Pseudomonadales bacterium]|nr:SagB/ThcOx family dehydrogenase [Pseudomonadales bacterium]
MIRDSDTKDCSLQKVLDYHAASKHAFQHFANGPGYLDWDTQPDPFRRYDGVRIITLETCPVAEAKPAMNSVLYDEAFIPGRIASTALDAQFISRLFFDSMAISAWKVAGSSRWALRVNPSSGNLHPTEAYLICGPVEGLSASPMVCHYRPLEHALEVLAAFDTTLWKNLCAGFPDNTVFVALTSIHWREAWKYGLRAYRYCQHDTGHAIGAVSIAAAGMGWQARILDDLGTEELAWLTGTFRAHDAEREEPDLLLALCPCDSDMRATGLPAESIQTFRSLVWHGQPNRLSSSHIEWGIEKIAEAARKPRTANMHAAWHALPTPILPEIRATALRKIIHQRRSAVDMDGVTRLSRNAFFHILQKTLPISGAAPFQALPWSPHIHLAIFVH